SESPSSWTTTRPKLVPYQREEHFDHEARRPGSRLASLASGVPWRPPCVGSCRRVAGGSRARGDAVARRRSPALELPARRDAAAAVDAFREVRTGCSRDG